jgi:hypothetical protein
VCLNLFAKTIYVDRPVEVIKEVQIYPDLDDFENEPELEAWYELHKNLGMGDGNLCDDYSRESRAIAALDGYNLEVYPMAAGLCYTTLVFDDQTYHMGNVAICKAEESLWYVDLAHNKLVRICHFAKGGKF